MSESWGSYLRRMRERRGMTQVQLAAAADVSESTIINQEGKGQLPTLAVFDAIVTALRLDKHDAVRILHQLDDQPVAEPLPAELDRIVDQYAAMTPAVRNRFREHMQLLIVWGDAELAAQAATRPRPTRTA